MHTKSTVKYICKHYVISKNKYYYKQELLTNDSWNNLESLYWSKPRPISERTFLKAKDIGFKCIVEEIKTPPAKIIQFTTERKNKTNRKRKKHYKEYKEVTARVRLILH